MIKSWKLEHFKSIDESMDELQFGKLTIFAGTNSSGKSTIIQSILMMMQTITNREHMPLQLNGDLVTLGHVEDVWNNGIFQNPNSDDQNTEVYFLPRPLNIHMTLQDSETQSLIRLELSFIPAEGNTQVRLAEGIYGIKDLNNESLVDNNDEHYSKYIRVKHKNDEIYYHEMSEKFQQEAIQYWRQRGKQVKSFVGDFQIKIHDFYPRTVKVVVPRNETIGSSTLLLLNPLSINIKEEDLTKELDDEAWGLIESAVNALGLSTGQQRGVFSFFRPTRLGLEKRTLQDYIDWYGKLSTTDSTRLKKYISDNLPSNEQKVFETWLRLPFFDIIERTLDEIFTRRIRYLSANRMAPTMVYGLDNSSNWSEVGVTGANAAGALRENATRLIRYWHPITKIEQQGSLLDAVNHWLEYFELGGSIRIEDQGKLGTLLRVKIPGVDRDLDLTAIGFGTSQILPIIIQGLLTEPNCLFIVEQPEVHLHPRVQSQLAYFFYGLSRINVNCIIETHSEHIVNQLRLLIARGDIPASQDVKVYFAERKPEYGTYYVEIQVNERGKILNWPKGFMDESSHLAQEILKAATQEG